MRIPCASVLVSLVACVGASAQYNERPDPFGSGSPAVDVSGRSIKNMRVRAIHTTDPTLLGGTAYFIKKDPFLAYQLGRNLNFREFRERDGVFGPTIGGLGGPMPDGTTAKITTNNQVSCAGCHNLPQGTPGGGVTFHKDSGKGRNSPHYFGAGLVEMLALQIRQDILQQLDTDGNGWISVLEASSHGGNVFVRPSPGTHRIDYGDPSLDGRATGKPQLNNIFRIWYVDSAGKHVLGATGVDGVNTVGYNFEMIVWGWGQGKGRSALNPTNRAFLWDPWVSHGGLEAFDPSTLDDPDGDGISAPTLAGAIQFPATHRPPDTGATMDALGFSTEDPDGDGYLNEISEGDLDLGEWFMLHAPRPAFAGTKGQFQSGVQLLRRMDCTECHVESWDIRKQGKGYDGDRRLWDFDVQWNVAARRLEGTLVPLYKVKGGEYVPDRKGFRVHGLFTDLRHHDLGPESAETDFGGTVNRHWRTPPLWGVGSSFPYHHDGQSLTLHDSILRHGGAAADSRQEYLNASPHERRRLLRFLQRLVLYDIESLPADINQDGVISPQFTVAGRITGMERFNAEWLFNNPLQIQGPVVNQDGVTILSNSGLNVAAAYCEGMPLRSDVDQDGWPDIWDNDSTRTGYKDGEN